MFQESIYCTSTAKYINLNRNVGCLIERQGDGLQFDIQCHSQVHIQEAHSTETAQCPVRLELATRGESSNINFQAESLLFTEPTSFWITRFEYIGLKVWTSLSSSWRHMNTDKWNSREPMCSGQCVPAPVLHTDQSPTGDPSLLKCDWSNQKPSATDSAYSHVKSELNNSLAAQVYSFGGDFTLDHSHWLQ